MKWYIVYWHRLHREVVESSSLEIFKIKFNVDLSCEQMNSERSLPTLIWWFSKSHSISVYLHKLEMQTGNDLWSTLSSELCTGRVVIGVSQHYQEECSIWETTQKHCGYAKNCIVAISHVLVQAWALCLTAGFFDLLLSEHTEEEPLGAEDMFKMLNHLPYHLDVSHRRQISASRVK